MQNCNSLSRTSTGHATFASSHSFSHVGCPLRKATAQHRFSCCRPEGWARRRFVTQPILCSVPDGEWIVVMVAAVHRGESSGYFDKMCCIFHLVHAP
jgi:hypothetical protein